MQLAPRDRVLVRPEPKEAPERHDCVSSAPADLVDHHSLDGSDVVALEVVYGRTFNTIVLNQQFAESNAGVLTTRATAVRQACGAAALTTKHPDQTVGSRRRGCQCKNGRFSHPTADGSGSVLIIA